MKVKPRIWRLGIASLSLLSAIAVYVFARTNPPETFDVFQLTNPYLVNYTPIFGSAPSFFYTLAIGLFIGVCASSRSSASFHCLAWIVLCLVLEISQHAVPSAWISARFPEAISESGWNLLGPYWTRGVFDPIDLFATLVGGSIAIALITRLPTEKRNADR